MMIKLLNVQGNKTGWLLGIVVALIGVAGLMYVDGRQAARQEEKEQIIRLRQSIESRQQFLISLSKRISAMHTHLFPLDTSAIDSDVKEFSAKYIAGEIDVKEPEYLRDELYALSSTCRMYLEARQVNVPAMKASLLLLPDVNLVDNHLRTIVNDFQR